MHIMHTFLHTDVLHTTDLSIVEESTLVVKRDHRMSSFPVSRRKLDEAILTMNGTAFSFSGFRSLQKLLVSLHF
jgi:hypothetical protein